MQSNHQNHRLCTILLLLAALGMCFFGAAAGEMGIVMNKAVNICMECIGLG